MKTSAAFDAVSGTADPRFLLQAVARLCAITPMGNVEDINKSMGQKYHSAMPQGPVKRALMAIFMGRGEGDLAWPIILISAYPTPAHQRGSGLENIALRS
jgi:hypothetical protein